MLNIFFYLPIVSQLSKKHAEAVKIICTKMFGICTKNKKTSRKVALHTTTFYNLPPLIFYLFSAVR